MGFKEDARQARAEEQERRRKDDLEFVLNTLVSEFHVPRDQIQVEEDHVVVDNLMFKRSRPSLAVKEWESGKGESSDWRPVASLADLGRYLESMESIRKSLDELAALRRAHDVKQGLNEGSREHPLPGAGDEQGV